MISWNYIRLWCNRRYEKPESTSFENPFPLASILFGRSPLEFSFKARLLKGRYQGQRIDSDNMLGCTKISSWRTALPAIKKVIDLK